MLPVQKLPFRKFYLGLILVVSIHSLVLGVGLLFVPSLFLSKAGWTGVEDLFFPSQSGIFMIILAGAYFSALKHYGMVYFILFSKLAAVAFLFTHFFVLSGPKQLFSALMQDSIFTVLLITVILLNRKKVVEG